MATIIDELIVKLGLDATKFEAEKKKAVSGIDDMKNGTDKASKSFESTAKSALSFFAVIGSATAFKNFVMDVAEGTIQLDNMAKNLGVTATSMLSMQNASKALGGSAQGLQGVLDMLSRSSSELTVKGDTGILPYMNALGISLVDANGKARPVMQTFMQLVDRLNTIGGDRTQAANFAKMMGIDSGTINMMMQGRQQIETEISRMTQYSQVTEKQTKESYALRQAYTEMIASFSAGGREIEAITAPALIKVYNWLTDMNQWLSSNGDRIKQFLPDFGMLAEALFVPAVTAAGLAMTQLTAAFMASPTGKVIALSEAIYLLYDDYTTWKNGGKSFIDWKNWTTEIDLVNKSINDLRSNIKDVMQTAQDMWNLSLPDYLAKRTKDQQDKFAAFAGEYNSGKMFDTNNIFTKFGGWLARSLSDVVGKGESGGDYNAYNTGTKGVSGGQIGYSGKTDMSQVSINDVLGNESKQGTDKSRLFAVGKYQFTAPFLRDAMKKMSLSGAEALTPQMQDEIFYNMLPQSTLDYINGTSNDKQKAIMDMSKMYRSIADPRTGSTYGDSAAGANRASISAMDIGTMLDRSRNEKNPTSFSDRMFGQTYRAMSDLREQQAGGPSIGGGAVTTTSIGTVTINTNHVDAGGILTLGNTVTQQNVAQANSGVN